MHDNLKKILFFAYFFPPLGGPGVQRACKIVRYLKEKRWLINVISVKDIVYHSYDEEMVWECKARNVYRTSSFNLLSLIKKYHKNDINRGSKLYFKTPEKIKKIIRNSFPIDDKIGWLPFAYFQALQVSRKNKFDSVMATIGPYTSGIVGYLISKKLKIPLVIDYRDHWTLHPYLRFPTYIHKELAEFWEWKILQEAKLVTTVSKTMKKELLLKYDNNLKDKIHVIYNGWDENDFKHINVVEKRNKVSFHYVGNFYGNQSPKYFVKALEELYKENSLPENVEIVFLGNYYIETIKILQKSNINYLIKTVPQVSHSKALEYMINSDVLLLFISSYRGKGVLTGKVFEYIRTKKEILAMIPPEGECAEILKSHNHKYICSMEDIKGIKKNFVTLNNYIRSGEIQKRKINNKFSRKHQTFKFEKILSKMLIRDGI